MVLASRPFLIHGPIDEDIKCFLSFLTSEHCGSLWKGGVLNLIVLWIRRYKMGHHDSTNFNFSTNVLCTVFIEKYGRNGSFMHTKYVAWRWDIDKHATNVLEYERYNHWHEAHWLLESRKSRPRYYLDTSCRSNATIGSQWLLSGACGTESKVDKRNHAVREDLYIMDTTCHVQYRRDVRLSVLHRFSTAKE